MALDPSTRAGVHAAVGGTATPPQTPHSRVGTAHHCARANRVASAATRAIAGLAALAFVSVAITFAVVPLLLPALGCAVIALSLKGCSCHSSLAGRIHTRRRAHLPWYSRMYNRFPSLRTRRTLPPRAMRVQTRSPRVAAALNASGMPGLHASVGGTRQRATSATGHRRVPAGGRRAQTGGRRAQTGDASTRRDLRSTSASGGRPLNPMSTRR